MNNDFEPDPRDRPVYGAAAIGRILGLSERQAWHRLEAGHLDDYASKIGGTWTSTPRRLLRIANGEKPLDAA